MNKKRERLLLKLQAYSITVTPDCQVFNAYRHHLYQAKLMYPGTLKHPAPNHEWNEKQNFSDGVVNELNCLLETLFKADRHKNYNNIATKTSLLEVFRRLNRYLSEHNAVSVSFLNIGEKIYVRNLRCVRILLTRRILDEFSRDSKARWKAEFQPELATLDSGLNREGSFFGY